MALNLTKAFKSALDILFNVAGELVRGATYYRPASFSSATGQTAATEQTAAVQMLVTNYRVSDSPTVVFQPGNEKALVRASELVSITMPGAGDYLIETTTGQRRDVLAARLDATGLLWTFQTVRSNNEDWGDLTTAALSADWGDLTAATEFEDRLMLV